LLMICKFDNTFFGTGVKWPITLVYKIIFSSVTSTEVVELNRIFYTMSHHHLHPINKWDFLSTTRFDLYINHYQVLITI
jgi:hypothetical protein